MYYTIGKHGVKRCASALKIQVPPNSKSIQNIIDFYLLDSVTGFLINR